MNQNKIKVLLVEDNPAEARLLQEALLEADNGHLHLSHVDSLSGAVEWLRHDRTDALLLDLSLPDSSGLHTLARAQEAAPETAIVVLTGNNDKQTAIEAVRMGAQDYLFKGEIHGLLVTRAISYAIERKKNQLERERLILELQDALAQVKQLSGLLPICASCKSIRDDKGYWQQLESYLDEHSDLKFTHGLCPKCVSKILADENVPDGK